ncbi:ABC transporter substrate-binding protein [Microbulbifer sp.]|uniref:ABC transporter substrate-binding protein n=1 Tax=Microbulbifer sp. TaxID=1908541 RepID=UPI003F376CEC
MSWNKTLLLLLVMAFGVVAQAAETRVFKNRFGEVKVPKNPRCVVSLHDFSLTVQLMELGVKPCGSTGRKKLMSEPLFRGVQHRFDVSGIQYVGGHKSPDLEAIAALKPDLILGLSYHRELKPILSAIAPVVILPVQEEGIKKYAGQLADLVGRRDSYEDQLKQYHWTLEEFRRLVPNPGAITVTTLEIYEDNFQLIGRGGMDEAIRDLGLGHPKAYKKARFHVPYSLERVGDFDADFIIDTYEPLLNTRRQTASFRESAQWRQLFAVRHGQFLYFNRSRYGESMGGLLGTASLLLSHIAERDRISLAEEIRAKAKTN